MSGRSYRLPSGRYQWRGRIEGRPVKHTEDTKRAADAWAARQQADAQRGELVDRGNRVTVYEWTAAWSANRVVRPNTRHGHRMLLGYLAGSPLGGRPVVRVQPSEVAAWAQGLAAQELAPATVAKFTGLLRAVMRAAVTDRVRAANPVLSDKDLGLPKMTREPPALLTVEEVTRWAGAAPRRYATMIITQAGTGLRISELAALRVTDVDFLRRRIDVNAQLSEDGRERVALKTGNSRRTVPLADHVADALAAHLAAFPAGPGGLIFTLGGYGVAGAAHGRPVRARVAWKHYRAAAVAAGLGPDLGTHVLRHHYASVLLDAGQSVITVAAVCGNTPAMIMAVYGHLIGDPAERVRAAVDAAWAQPDAGAEAR